MTSHTYTLRTFLSPKLNDCCSLREKPVNSHPITGKILHQYVEDAGNPSPCSYVLPRKSLREKNAPAFTFGSRCLVEKSLSFDLGKTGVASLNSPFPSVQRAALERRGTNNGSPTRILSPPKSISTGKKRGQRPSIITFRQRSAFNRVNCRFRLGPSARASLITRRP